MNDKILVCIPTYNERENVEKISQQLYKLNINFDVLFIDDNSPDGTGDVLDRLEKNYKNLKVIHRKGKEGIGTAHSCGITYAYENDYDLLITMDSDFTHNPDDISKLLIKIKDADIVVGSRFVKKNSLPGWSRFRLILTHFGHFLTKFLLGVKEDATGAFRIYNLRNIPQEIFKRVESKSYSFFFESLFYLNMNGYTIDETPITLAARTYGHSKLNFKEVIRNGLFLIKLSLRKLIQPAAFRIDKAVDYKKFALKENEEWNVYWQKKKNVNLFIYEVAATIYRKIFIKSHLQRHIKNNFEVGSSLLHAGCGSGQVDVNLHQDYQITALDLSSEALVLYSKNNPTAKNIVQADILNLELEPCSFDGIYNLGVFEHFSHSEIKKILEQFQKLLKSEGKIVIFWPHRLAWSVLVLKIAHYILNRIFKKNIRLHPEEPSLLHGKKSAESILSDASFELTNYTYNIKDLFVQAVVVAKPRRV